MEPAIPAPSPPIAALTDAPQAVVSMVDVSLLLIARFPPTVSVEVWPERP